MKIFKDQLYTFKSDTYYSKFIPRQSVDISVDGLIDCNVTVVECVEDDFVHEDVPFDTEYVFNKAHIKFIKPIDDNLI